MANAKEKFESVRGDIVNVLKVDRRSYLVAANRFFARYIIEEPLRKQIYKNSGVSAVNLLLDGLHAAIERDPKYLDEVVEVLSEDQPSLCAAFKKMNDTFEPPVPTDQTEASAQHVESHVEPNEVVSLLEDKVQSNPDAVLAVNDLSSKFDHLYSLASSSLQHVKLEDLKVPLESKLSHSPKMVKDRFRPLLKDITSTPQFFSFLLEHKFCGFLNFNLVSIYTKRFGSEALKQEMSQYETSYQSFSKAIKMKDLLHSILNNPTLSKPLAPIGLPMIKYMLEESWYSRSYACLFDVISGVHSWCGSGNMMFNDIEEQCIIVTYVLFGEEDLELVSEDVTSPEKRQLLKECGITITIHTGAKSKLNVDRKQSKSRLHKFEESVTCPLCKELFKDPKVLSCHHSFCLDCLQQVKKTEEGSILCPVCRKEEKLPQEGVRGLPAAHHLSSIIEVAEMLNIKDTSTELVSGRECSSEGCDKVPVAWCANDCGYLCEECSDNHSKMRVTKSHDMRLIKELQKDQDIPLFCKRHKEQYRQYQCMDCKKLVCHECLQYCSDCRKLICGDCLNEHGYPNVSSLTIKKSGLHNVHLLKNLIEHGKATEIELEREECELKLLNNDMKLYISDLKGSFEKMGVSLDDQISSKQEDCTKRRKELVMAGQTACEFISGDRIVSAPEQAFQVLMEYSANSEDSSSSEHGVAKMWLFWSPNEPQSLEMIEKIQPQHIKVKFPTPFRMSRDNGFLISLTNLLPVRPSGNLPLPVVSIKGVLSETNYPCSIEQPFDNVMTWFVLFNANEKKIKVDVVFEGVHAGSTPKFFQDDSDDPENIDDYARMNKDDRTMMNDRHHMNQKTIKIRVLQICLISCIIVFIIFLPIAIAYAYA